MTNDAVIIRFGDTEIISSDIRAWTHNSIEGTASASITIPNDLLKTNEPDYRAEVSIAATTAPDQPIFTGLVNSVDPTEHETHISLITQTKVMEEMGIAGLSTKRADARELMWALSVLGGYEEEQVIVEGWEPSTEYYSVACPVDGIAIENPLAVGGAILASASDWSDEAARVDSDSSGHLEGLYSGASAWIVVSKLARTMYEAEKEGLRDIDRVLAWLTARVHYSLSTLPEGQLNDYQRDLTRTRISRRDIVLVSGRNTGSQWLRVPDVILDYPTLPYEKLVDLQSLALPYNIPLQLKEAITTWKRAAESTELFTGTVALWEAIEFYAAKVTVHKPFPQKMELDSVKERATEGLSGEQEKRVKEVLSLVNQAPLMSKLKTAIREDDVPHTEKEIELLTQLRKTRNKLVHGKPVEAPSEKDFRYAVAIVGRMLVYRVSRLSNELE